MQSGAQQQPIGGQVYQSGQAPNYIHSQLPPQVYQPTPKDTVVRAGVSVIALVLLLKTYYAVAVWALFQMLEEKLFDWPKMSIEAVCFVAALLLLLLTWEMAKSAAK